MWHPDIEEIQEAHEQASYISKIRKSGWHLSMDRGVEVLESIVEEAKEVGNNETVFKAAAIYLKKIICKHPFADGNHRTALITTVYFLRQNDELFMPKRTTEEEKIIKILKEEIRRMDIRDVAGWVQTGELP